MTNSLIVAYPSSIQFGVSETQSEQPNPKAKPKLPG
jgi:hypothetical protein